MTEDSEHNQDAVNLGWKLAQVVHGTSPDDLLQTYHTERHPVGARVLRNTMALTALERGDHQSDALRGLVTELMQTDEARKRYFAMMTGLDVHYDLGQGHPLLGRRLPDLDLVIAGRTQRAFDLLHEARPVLLNLSESQVFDTVAWADRVRLIDAQYTGAWELPVLGLVPAPTAVLVRPDGYVAWVGQGTDRGLRDATTTWFGAALESSARMRFVLSPAGPPRGAAPGYSASRTPRARLLYSEARGVRAERDGLRPRALSRRAGRCGSDSSQPLCLRRV